MGFERLSYGEPFSRIPASKSPEKSSGGHFDGKFKPLRTQILTDRVSVGGTVSNVTDRSVQSLFYEETQVNADLEISPVESTFASTEWEELKIHSSDESIAVPVAGGRVNRVANGVATITASTPSGREWKFRFIAREIGDAPFSVYTNHVPGSLGAHCSDQVDNRIEGKDRNVVRQIYSSYPSNSGYTDVGEARGAFNEFIRNPLFWGSDIPNMPCYCVAVQRAGETNWRRNPHATLISPIHWISCFHAGFYPRVGQKLAFVTMSGELVVRTTVGLRKHLVESEATPDGYNPSGLDSVIGILDSPVPISIPPAKVMPLSTLVTKMPIDQQQWIPGMFPEQQQRGCVGMLKANWQGPRWLGNWSAYGWAFHGFEKRLEFVDQPEDQRTSKQPGLEVGDSGCPAFLIVNNELVLCTTWTVPGAGPYYTENWHWVQYNMDQLSTLHGKQQFNLTYTDINGFTTF